MGIPARPRVAPMPTATYRVQMNHHFPFRALAREADYYRDLGVSDLYLSPIFAARPGSLHGYDIVNYGILNPELGSRREFTALSDDLQQMGLGVILDIVPNHMAAVPENPWWRDILENGRSSPYASFFDIDFHPPQPGLEEQVLLPILDEPFARVLESGRLRADFSDGSFFVTLYEHRFPLAVRSWPTILEPVIGRVKSPSGRSELEGLLADIAVLPVSTLEDADRRIEARLEKEGIKRRLQALVRRDAEVEPAIRSRLEEINGRVGQPSSFDTLDRILAQQPYRMSFWHVAADEINYRRFFDITDLAALKVEDPAVFREVHRLPLELVHEGRIRGLRVDHIDGLYDPEAYLRHLRRAAGDSGIYLVVEKILTGGETLPGDWPVEGTTGYDFLNAIGGLFVDVRHESRFRDGYTRFTGRHASFDDVLYESRRLILSTTMTGELRMLATRLTRIAKHHRQSRDFTLHALEKALAEVLACFPVYRTYAGPAMVRPRELDLKSLEAAVFEAKDRNPALREETFDFVESVLAFRDPEGLPEDRRRERRRFALRFQQVTGPMMAKGMEDTAFYRWFPLVSLNEVGGDPRVFGIPPERVHEFLARRRKESPYALNTTGTHDTKRGEDARLRIHALSEIPDQWEAAIAGWKTMNAAERTDPRIPDGNEEYLIYQTLLGSWPVGGAVDDTWVRRIQGYLTKALREAKVRTSWIRVRERYERRVLDFVEAILRSGGAFAREFAWFAERIARAAVYSSLSQSALRILAPGVPDFYQGSELWDVRLVDPDNRGPVDYEVRRRLLASLDGTVDLEAMLASPWDGRLKLHVLRRALRVRNRMKDVVDRGRYEPVTMEGGAVDSHAFGFTRASSEGSVTVLAGRLFLTLGADQRPPIGPGTWLGTSAAMENGRYRDAISDREVVVVNGRLPLQAAFQHLPVAILVKG